ncbi:MAG TPA: VWA domain-containing protein [Pyrinomonadaceae bacterium]|jgi:VWFA-related protein
MRYLLCLLLLLPLVAVAPPLRRAASQTRPRTVTDAKAPDAKTSAAKTSDEIIKVDADLVVLDALVMQRETGRVVGGLAKEDFVLEEDGQRQQITHFSQDKLPLSVLLLIDRGGCLDPFGTQVRQAARNALAQLKPADEVAVMAYHESVNLLQGFTGDRAAVADAIERVPGHDEEADHCLNRALSEAATYMIRAGNPTGRRVIVVITGVTSNFDCKGPSGGEVLRDILESGSVVCGVIPRSAGQKLEDGVTKVATGVGGLFLHTLSLGKLAEETGGEVLGDKPERLEHVFGTLVEHLRTRYSMGFVPANKKHDGTRRKLKLQLARKDAKKLVVKTRRSYIAPRV